MKRQNNFQSNEQENSNQRGGETPRGPRFNFTWLYFLLIMGLIYFVFFPNSSSRAEQQLVFSDFQECVDSGYVRKILIDKGEMELTFEVNTQGERHIYGQVAQSNRDRKQLVVEIGSLSVLDEYLNQMRDEGKLTAKVEYQESSNTFLRILVQFLPIITFFVIIYFLMNRMQGPSGGMGGIFNVGKSKAKLFEKDSKNQVKVTFRDVAGQIGAKQEVQEIVDFLKQPEKYTTLGGKIPKGALLVGPPGTGKTLLAKAVAGEADVPFFSMSGSDFVEMFVGVGASRVRDLFQQAKAKSPCIIFIDEIDAIGRARSKNTSMGSNDERESTLNQLLTEMDGFGTNSGVIILAATNRADILDKALLRAGRFDRQIHVDLPDVTERKAIFNVHLRPIKIDETVDVDLLARQTPGFSGADIANVCNEAALIAARGNKKWVDRQCFLDAVDRIIGGLEKKTKVMTDAEKRTIALHEAGHATISWFLQYANPLVKVTIVPRGRALGAAWYMPEERQITTKEEMLDEICATLGGRAAEEVCLGRISTGAMNDLETVTKRSFMMIAYAGMGDMLPNLCYYNNDEYGFSKPYSEHTAEIIDKEVKTLIAEQYERAKNILREHQEGHSELAQLLIEKEVIFAEDVERIFGKRPWQSRADEIMASSKADGNNQAASDTQHLDYIDVNEDIVRQKAIDAVVEKAKEQMQQGESGIAASPTPTKPSQPETEAPTKDANETANA
jgi:cell division protease FtsH